MPRSPGLRALDEPFSRGVTGQWAFLLSCPAVPGQLGASAISAALEYLDPGDRAAQRCDR
jgi:hypothetical protein